MKIIMPLSVNVGRKKYTINLNYYRNWHFQVSNKVKSEYQKIVIAQIGLSPICFKKINLIFTFYPSTKRRVDRSNILSIHEKFLCDALTKVGVIKDDNDSYIESSFYCTGIIDKTNPRVEIEIDGVLA